MVVGRHYRARTRVVGADSAHGSDMAIPVPDLVPGDRIRFRGSEFDVGRIDSPFLGRDAMVCIIEDSPTRWHAYPAPKTESVETLRD